MERVRRGCGTSETRWALACHTCRGLAHAGRQNSQWECYSQAEESGQREGLQESELRQVDQAWGEQDCGAAGGVEATPGGVAESGLCFIRR